MVTPIYTVFLILLLSNLSCTTSIWDNLHCSSENMDSLIHTHTCSPMWIGRCLCLASFKETGDLFIRETKHGKLESLHLALSAGSGRRGKVWPRPR